MRFPVHLSLQLCLTPGAPEHCDSAVTPLPGQGRVRERRHQIPEIRYCSSNSPCWLPLHQGLRKGGQLTVREQGCKFHGLQIPWADGFLLSEAQDPGPALATLPWCHYRSHSLPCSFLLHQNLHSWLRLPLPRWKRKIIWVISEHL